jgi:hypothetical protein
MEDVSRIVSETQIRITEVLAEFDPELEMKSRTPYRMWPCC